MTLAGSRKVDLKFSGLVEGFDAVSIRRINRYRSKKLEEVRKVHSGKQFQRLVWPR